MRVLWSLGCCGKLFYSKGDSLLLDDGKLRMTVLESGDNFVSCRVDVGGKLSNKKGVNTPTVRLPISAMTPKVNNHKHAVVPYAHIMFL